MNRRVSTGAGRERVLTRREVVQLGASALLPACQQKAVKLGPVQRVISISPSTTEAVFALGAGAKLVGRSRYCDYPKDVARIPVVGGYVDASFEAILALAPDLVVGVHGPGGPALRDRLRARAIPTYFPETESLAQIDAMLRGVAERLEARAQGEALIASIHAASKKVAALVARRPRPRTLLVFGVRPIVVAGREGFAGEMLELAGAENAVRGTSRYPTLGVEELLAANPDLVIDATGSASHDGEGFSGDLPGFRELQAIKRGQLRQIRDERVLRPGPRVADGIAILARVVHPTLEVPG